MHKSMLIKYVGVITGETLSKQTLPFLLYFLYTCIRNLWFAKPSNILEEENIEKKILEIFIL